MPCGACGVEGASLRHFPTCEKIQPIFHKLAELAGDRLCQPCDEELRPPQGPRPDADAIVERNNEIKKRKWLRFALFALPMECQTAHNSIETLHLLLWKYIIAAITQANTEGEKFTEKAVWLGAWRQWKLRARAKEETIQAKLRRADSRGWAPPDVTKTTKLVTPLAEYTEEGYLKINPEIGKKIDAWSGATTTQE